jgi:hypothetical protein
MSVTINTEDFIIDTTNVTDAVTGFLEIINQEDRLAAAAAAAAAQNQFVAAAAAATIQPNIHIATAAESFITAFLEVNRQSVLTEMYKQIANEPVVIDTAKVVEAINYTITARDELSEIINKSIEKLPKPIDEDIAYTAAGAALGGFVPNVFTKDDDKGREEEYLKQLSKMNTYKKDNTKPEPSEDEVKSGNETLKKIATKATGDARAPIEQDAKKKEEEAIAAATASRPKLSEEADAEERAFNEWLSANLINRKSTDYDKMLYLADVRMKELFNKITNVDTTQKTEFTEDWEQYLANYIEKGSKKLDDLTRSEIQYVYVNSGKLLDSARISIKGSLLDPRSTTPKKFVREDFIEWLTTPQNLSSKTEIANISNKKDPVIQNQIEKSKYYTSVIINSINDVGQTTFITDAFKTIFSYSLFSKYDSKKRKQILSNLVWLKENVSKYIKGGLKNRKLHVPKRGLTGGRTSFWHENDGPFSNANDMIRWLSEESKTPKEKQKGGANKTRRPHNKTMKGKRRHTRRV